MENSSNILHCKENVQIVKNKKYLKLWIRILTANIILLFVKKKKKKKGPNSSLKDKA